MSGVLWLLVALGMVWILAYHGTPLWLWTAILGVALAAVSLFVAFPTVLLILAWVGFAALALVLNVYPLRRRLLTQPLFASFCRLLPPMSQTEREALEAGTVWWEAELFSGAPRWRRLASVPAPWLSPEEQAFLDGPVEELCRMLDDWDITHTRQDLPPEVWRFIKEQGFWGMIIPKRYGGLEFSAQAHSAVVMKVASRSIVAAVTVMVPNSLGPAELLLHYGTEEQKNYYLPRLARGEEVPCFALTSPEAGSDASSMPDRGVVCRGQHNGRETLGIRLNWEKRYITLGPVATVLGLAFRLFDPDHLLGKQEDLGITLALIPTNTPGVEIGERHNPLNIPFQNGPNRGRNVFIPLDWVIGGREGVGRGWRMLMERLAVGRGISLPALSTATGKFAARATGAYARIRKQFKLPIGRFEAVQEALARIAGYTYLMDAARTLSARAVDLGEKPAVVSAIVKYHLTEHMRRVVNDAMDIQGGGGICLGPRNFMGRVYQALPISITVEGANILTRALIIYGQGAVRCHPYVLKEIKACADPDAARALRQFDRALFGHIGFVIRNAARAVALGITDGRLARVPFPPPARRYAQKLALLSAAFALTSDMAMLVLGGTLKRRESISGRFADVLAFMYLASAVIKRFEDQGRPKEDVPLLHWACQYALHQAEHALIVLLKNFPNRYLGRFVRALVFPAGRRNYPPADSLDREVAALLLAPSAARDRLTAGIYVPAGTQDALGRIEDALPKVVAAEAAEKKLQAFVEAQPLLTGDLERQLTEARRAGVLDEEEAELAATAYAARRAVIEVDSFPSLGS